MLSDFPGIFAVYIIYKFKIQSIWSDVYIEAKINQVLFILLDNNSYLRYALILPFSGKFAYVLSILKWKILFKILF